jgi:hypothetical protein
MEALRMRHGRASNPLSRKTLSKFYRAETMADRAQVQSGDPGSDRRLDSAEGSRSDRPTTPEAQGFSSKHILTSNDSHELALILALLLPLILPTLSGMIARLVVLAIVAMSVTALADDAALRKAIIGTWGNGDFVVTYNADCFGVDRRPAFGG